MYRYVCVYIHIYIYIYIYTVVAATLGADLLYPMLYDMCHMLGTMTMNKSEIGPISGAPRARGKQFSLPPTRCMGSTCGMAAADNEAPALGAARKWGRGLRTDVPLGGPLGCLFLIRWFWIVQV